MDTQQQVKETVPPPAKPPFVLTDILQMASPQGVLLKPKSEEEVIQAIKDVVMERECILSFQHVRVLQGGIEMDMFVMSSLATSLLTENSTPATASISPPLPADARHLPTPTESTSSQPEACRGMIQKEIGRIFQNKQFCKDSFMANSPLHSLVVIEQARQAWIDEQNLSVKTLSQRDKASILRHFLTKCLDEQLCPEPGKAIPEKLSEATSQLRDEWLEYLILRWQYVNDKLLAQVQNELKETTGNWVTGGTYKRYRKTARERLSTLIWQKEMQVLLAQKQ